MGGFRRTLVRLIRYFILRPVALFGWLAALFAIVAAILLFPLFAPSVPALNQLRGNPPPAATEDYMRGNRDYNADLVWSSLSSDAQNRLQTQGGSVEGLQQQMEAARQQGIRLDEISYVGGKTLPDGTSMQFYLVGIRQQSRPDLDYQPYMFTLDRDGKIAKVQ
ncbi:MAG TPA: hypothetical protein VFB50_15160, partial [Chloroflexota bacterium]|nr:hypothetical protein [Chloroflexota bacterium]